MKKRLFTSILVMMAAMALPSSVWADTETYDFTNRTNNSGRILDENPTTVSINSSTTLYPLVSESLIFADRFAVGPTDRKTNGFMFKNYDSEQGLYSQYDNRNFAIRNLKQGDKVTIVYSAGGDGGSLKFSGTPSLTGENLNNAVVSSNSAYTVSADCDLLMVTAKSSVDPKIYITSVVIETAEDNKPVISQNGNIVTITAKSGYTTYYTLDGSDPTTSSASFDDETKELELNNYCTVKAFSVKNGVTGGTIETKMAEYSYTRPTATEYGKYDFTSLVSSTNTQVLAANPNPSFKLGETEYYYLKANNDAGSTFDNRFAVGKQRQDSGNGWKFYYNNGTYKGLYSQYDNRYLSILDLKDGDMYVITTSKDEGTLGVVSGQLYTKSGDGNVDLTTTGSVYIESIVIGTTSQQLAIACSPGNNGAITTSKADNKALPTEKVTITVTPNNGYSIKASSIKVNNVEVSSSLITTVAATGVATFTLTMPDTAPTVSAEFISNAPSENTITFDSEGGSTVTAITAAAGASITWPENPTKNGYDFVGWFEEGASEAYSSTTTMPAESITLTAHWTAIAYTITYNLGSESGITNNNPTSYTIESEAITLSAPTWEGKTFNGWKGTGNTGDLLTSVTIAQGSTGNKEFTAHWAGTISFASNTVTKTVGDGAFTNALTNNGDGTVTYSIEAGETEATINTSTGEVTLGSGTGTATITATVDNGTNFDYATTAAYTLTVNAKAEETIISTAKTWTFDSYNTGDYHANNSNSYIAVDGLYARSLSARKFVITAGSEATAYSFTDGTSGTVTNYAKISGEYSGTNATVTSAAQNSGYLTPFFAFNTSVAGTCYAWVKSSGESNQNVRIYYTSGNGSFDCPSGAYTTSNTAREIKQTASAGGTFFIGSTTNAVGEIYAIRFVPTHTLTFAADPADKATITIKDGNTALTSGSAIEEGKTLTIEVSGITEGYEVDNVKVNNGDALTADANGKYTFTMPTADATVTVTLKLKSYTLTAAQATNGSISFTVGGQAATTAKMGDEVTVVATPDTNYQLSTLAATPNTVTISDNKFTMPASNVEVTATFTSTAVTPTEFSYGTFDFKNFVINNSIENGTKPTWGATIDGADVQVLTYVSGSINETFGNRFAAGPVAQNATDNCFKFRNYAKEKSGTDQTYTGLYSQYAADPERILSVMGLVVGDRITFTFASANTTLTYGDNVSVVNNQTITVTEAGRMDFKAVAGVVITQVKIEAPLTQYTVTAESTNTEQGTVAITNASSDNKYDQGSSVTITATAKSGYEFDYWTNGESTDSYSTTNPLTITSLDANFTLKAHFKAQSTTPVTSSYWTYNYAQMAVAMITADNTKKSITWTRNEDNSSKLTVNSNAVYPVYIDAYQSEGNLMADRGDGILKFGDVYNIGLTNNSNATNYYAIKNVKANDIIKITYNGGGTSSAMKELPSLEDLYNATESSETSTYTLNFNYGGKDRTLNYTEKTLTVTADGPVGFSLKDGYIAKITVGTAYTVNAAVETAGTGTVSVTSPEYMQIGDEFIAGTKVTLKAEAASGYEFKAWKEGDTQVATTAEYTIENLSANKSLTAVFEQSVVNYTIRVVAGENGSIKVEKGEDDVTTAVAAGAEYVTGTSLKLTAIPAEGYEFVNWTNGTTEVSKDNPYTVSLTEDITLTANFKVYVAPVEAKVGETRNWLFNDLTTGDVYNSITEVNGAYLRASNSNPGSRTMTVTDLTPQTLTFADGAEVSVSKYLAVGHSMYPLAFTESSTAASTTASDNGTIGSGSFAVNTTVAGTIYVKIGTTADQNVRIYCTDAISSPKTFALKAADGIQEVSYTTTAETGGTFFIGGVGGKYDIYAVRFVPTSEATKYTLTVGEVTNGTITVKDGSTTIDGSAQVLPGATLTLTATPDDGYQLKEWQNGSGSAIGAIQNSMVTTVAMPAEAMTVKAVFEALPESVTAITKDQTLTFDSYPTGISLSGSKVYAASDNLYINGHSDSAPAQVTANGISEGVTLGSAGVTVGKSLWMRGGNDKDLSGKAVNSYVQDAIGLIISEKGLLYVLLSGKTSGTDRYFNIYVNGVKNQTKIADNNPVVISQAITETSNVFITVSGGDWRAYAIRFEAVEFKEQETDDKEGGSKVYAVVTDDGATIAAASIAETDETITISKVDDKPVTDIAAGVFTESNTANVSAIDLSETAVNWGTETEPAKRDEVPALANIDASTLIYLPSTANVTGTNVVIKSGAGDTYTCSDFEVDNGKLENGKSVVVPKEFKADKVTLKRTFTADKKCTVCLPYAFTAAGGTFYKFNGISEGKVQMQAQTDGATLEANTPYIFMPDNTTEEAGNISTTASGEKILVAIKDAETADASSSFTFKGTYEAIDWTENPTKPIYGFAAEDKDGSEVGSFVKIGAGASIKACRAYLEYEGNSTPGSIAETRGMNDLPDVLEIEWIPASGKGTTGIEDARRAADDSEAVYNIRGQRVDKNYKGLVIVNGKKVVRK